MSDVEVYEDLCYNEIITKRVKYVWKIRDFSKRTDNVISSVFPSSSPKNVGKWRLELIPNGKNTNHRLFVDEVHSSEPVIFIDLKRPDVVSTQKVKFSLINDKGDIAKSKEYGNNTRYATLADRNFVLNKDNGLLPNDELTVICEIEVTLPPENRCHVFLPAKCEPPPCRLSEDWGNLLSSRSLSDVTIAVGGSELRAHKAVLAARSPVFAAMFSNEMLEKQTSVVEITDMDADVFQAMLEFMYTGKEISQMSLAHDLLAAASKYQLDRLKFMCEEALSKSLSVDNALENLALADFYNAPRLKEHCISFVMAHRADLRLAWEILKRSEKSLVTEMFENICLQE